MDLKSLMVDSKEVWIDFPGLKGFKVKVANPSRTEITKLRTKCTSQKFDRKTRQLVETLDEERFVAEFTKATVKDWSGLTIGHLETLVLIEPGTHSLDTEVEYSEESAEMLVNNSQEFDQWLNEVVFDLGNFRSGTKGKSAGKTGKTV